MLLIEKINSLSSKVKKILFTTLMCLAIVIFWMAREPIFFRDYAIIWEGVGRMLAGYSPFSDFGMPVGPIVLFIPYIFAKFLGFTWLSLQLSQLFQNFLLIILGSSVLNKLTSSTKIYFSAMGLYSLFYISFLMHPWYNTTAFLLLLCAIYFSLFKNPGLIFISGIFAALCIFCKQDYGFMTIISCLILILGHELIKISDFKQMNMKPIFLKILKRIGIFSLGAVLVIGIFLFLYEDDYISYWYGLSGSSDLSYRKLFALITAYKNGLMYLAIIGLILGFKFRSFVLLICSVMLLVSGVARYTSGLYFTSFFFWLFLPPYLYEIKYSVFEHLKGSLKLFFIFAISISIALAIKAPLENIYKFWTSTLSNKPEHYYFDSSKIVLPVSNLGECTPVLENIYSPGNICKSLEEIRLALSDIDSPLVLNISEFTPLTELVSGEYPLNLPLWYHLGVTLHDREIEDILFKVNANAYDLVAVQCVLTEPTFFEKKLLLRLRQKSNYIELNPIVGPMRATDIFTKPQECSGDIYIFVQK